MPVILRTLGSGVEFAYEGSVATGLRLTYGKNNNVKDVAPDTLRQLIDHFGKQAGPVKIGASRDKPSVGSIGEWLRQNYKGPQIASYLAPVLVEEGYAQVSGELLVFARD
jgi:hypothetical protein